MPASKILPAFDPSVLDPFDRLDLTPQERAEEMRRWEIRAA
jgi:hypothetical protein